MIFNYKSIVFGNRIRCRYRCQWCHTCGTLIPSIKNLSAGNVLLAETRDNACGVAAANAPIEVRIELRFRLDIEGDDLRRTGTFLTAGTYTDRLNGIVHLLEYGREVLIRIVCNGIGRHTRSRRGAGYRRYIQWHGTA